MRLLTMLSRTMAIVVLGNAIIVYTFCLRNNAWPPGHPASGASQLALAACLAVVSMRGAKTEKSFRRDALLMLAVTFLASLSAMLWTLSAVDRFRETI